MKHKHRVSRPVTARLGPAAPAGARQARPAALGGPAAEALRAVCPPRQRGISRRRFLAVGAVAGLSVAGVGAASSRAAPAWSTRQWVVQVVRTHLPGITLDEDALQQFARDVLADPQLLGPRRRQVVVSLHRVSPLLADRMKGGSALVHKLERQVFSSFLVSSNFFPSAGQDGQPVRYSGQLGACSNIFAQYHEA